MFFFFKKKPVERKKLKVDIHSHLIPGIDDGVENMEQALEIIRGLNAMGYEKVITTPHIMGDFYPNTPEIIHKGLDSLREAVRQEGIGVTLEAAAEYYLDEFFMEALEGNAEMMTFGDGYVLFETAFMNEPIHLKEAVFCMKSLGYKPVYAHPERYMYLHQDFSILEDLMDRGVFLQVNLNSLMGYYSKPVQKMAEKLIDSGMVHFLGSDCHNMKQLHASKLAVEKKYYAKALELDLLNDTLA